VEFELCPQDGVQLESETVFREAQTEWPTGKVIGGKYRISRRLGEDEIATIYEAHTLSLNAPRVVRVLKSRFAADTSASEEFRKTADLLQRSTQANVIAVEGRGNAEDGRPFFVTEYVQSQTLAELMQAEGPLDPQRACSIARQTALALSAAHQHGLLHLNLTPANILVSGTTDKDAVKVQGFGVAYVRMRWTLNGHSSLRDRLPADFRYASPELALGTNPQFLDERSDLYSLGAIIYEMLTGEVAFVGANGDGASLKSAVATLAARFEDSAPPLRVGQDGMEVPPPVGALVTQLLERRPELRLASAQAFIEKILLAESGMMSVVKPESGAELAENVPPAGFREVAPPRTPFAGKAIGADDRGPQFDMDLLAAPSASFESAPDSANPTSDVEHTPAPRVAAVPTRPAAVAPRSVTHREAASTLFRTEPPPLESHFARWALAAVALLALVAGALFFITRSRTQWLGAGPLSPVKSDELRSVEGANTPPSQPSQSTSQPASSAQAKTTPATKLAEPPQQPVTAPPGSLPSPGATPSQPGSLNDTKSGEPPTSGAAPSAGSSNKSLTSKPPTTGASASPAATASMSPEDLAAQVKRAIAAGDVFFELGQYDYAIRAYQGPLKYDPQNRELKLKIERAQKAKAAEEQYLAQ